MPGILIIDDLPEVHADVKWTADAYQVPVYHAYNGAEAVEVWENNRHDIEVILLDYKFERQPLQGHEIFDLLMKKDPDLKIIVLTGYQMDKVHEQFGPDRMARVLEFVSKPLSLTKFAEIYSKHLKIA